VYILNLDDVTGTQQSAYYECLHGL